ncbi:hypothetical protein FACS1894199_15040 [Bacteroidia bacterium]|nr:hypothetical protein FACS1894199_15040 [Bacteroidia bacterium]
MKTRTFIMMAATAAMLVTANLVTMVARADITSFPYTNNINNSIDVSGPGWTLSGMTYTSNYSGSLHFGTDGYVIMPELSVGVGVVPSVQITALFGDYIELHTSSDGGSTYTYHADFTGGENSQVSVRACPAGTRFIKFVVKSGYANYPYLQALTITLQTVAVTGVTLNKPSTTLVMAEGGTETLTATVEPNDATNQVVTWDSDNTAVATVNNGEIAAVAPGTATITVTTTEGNFQAACEVTVSATRIYLASVALKPSTTLFAGGSTETLTPLFTPNDATNKNVSWISSAPSIASVSNGVVTPEAVGDATITVTTADGNFTADCAVTVKEPTLDTVRIAWTSGSKNISYTASSTVTVDWGDGSAVETFGSGSSTAYTAAAYDAPGAYTATIAGTGITELTVGGSNYALAVDLSKAPNLIALDCDGNLITDGNLRLNSNPALMVAAGGNYLSAAALNTLGFQLDCSGCGPQAFSAIATVGTPVALKVNIDIYDDATVMYNNASAASGVDFTIIDNDITFLKEGAYRVPVMTAYGNVNNYITAVSGDYTEQRINITLDTKGSTDSTVFALSASYGQPFTVDWGDGTQQTYNGTGETAPINTTDGMSPLTLKHKYTTAGTQNVSITAPFGTLLTALHANHDDGYSVFTALDVTQAPALERLQCNNHKLATLDLSKNPWLGLIHCGYNRLTQLQLNTDTYGEAKFNGAGIQVQCQRNLLETTLVVGSKHFVENCSGNAMGLQQLYDLRQALAVNGSSSVFGTQNKWRSGAANTPIPLVEPATLGGASTATVVTVKNSEGTTISSGSDYTYTQGTGITFTTDGYYTVELTNAAITASGATKVIYNFNVGMPAQSIAFDWAAASAATVKTLTLEANERDFTVDWGDGNTETFAGEDIGTPLTLSHTYDDAGDYTVSIDAADDFGTFYALDLSNTELTSLTTLTAPLLTSLNLSNNSLTLENLKDIKASVPVSVSITYGLQTLPQVTTAVNIEHVIDNVYGNSSLASIKKIQLASSDNAAGGDYTWTQGDGKIKFNTNQYVYEVTLTNAALTGAQVKYTFVVGDVPFPNVKVTFRISDPAEKVNLYAGTIPVGALVTVSYGDGRPNATIVGNGVYTQVIANNLSYAAPGSYTITCTANNINDHFARVSISNSTAKSVILDGSGEPQLVTFNANNNYFDTLTFAGCTHLTQINAGGNPRLAAVRGFGSCTALTNSGYAIFYNCMMSMKEQADLVTSRPSGLTSTNQPSVNPQVMPIKRVNTGEEQVIDNRAAPNASVYVYQGLGQNTTASNGSDYTTSGGKITFLNPGVYTVRAASGMGAVNDYSPGWVDMRTYYTFIVGGAALTVPKRTVPFTETAFAPAQWLAMNNAGVDAQWEQSLTEGKNGGEGLVLTRTTNNGSSDYTHLLFDVAFPAANSNIQAFKLTFDYKLVDIPSVYLYCNLSDTSMVPSMDLPPAGYSVSATTKGSWQTATATLSTAMFAGTVKRLVFSSIAGTTTGVLVAIDNLSITPVSTFTVTFSTDGGSAVAELNNVADGATISAPAPPTKSGSTFVAWYKEVGLTNAWNFDSDVVSTNITLYAKWLNHYTVTFNTNGGSAVAALTDVPDGTTIAAPAPPTKVGSTFVAWYKEAGLTNAWDFATDVVSTNITLYAKWLNLYTVTFDTDGGSAVAALNNVADGATIAAPTPPTKADYNFAGWYKEAGLTNAWNFASDVVTAAVTLYAKWVSTSVPTYTVTFNVDGGSAVAALTNVPDGTTITAPTPPTKADYNFAGWYKEAGCTNQWNFATDVVTAAVTLYAKWVSTSVPTYTVTFNAQGGSVVAAQIIAQGEKATQPANPTRAGYNFSGWFTEAGYTTAWNFPNDAVTADITLYAKWVSTSVPTYAVTFDAQGGSTVLPLNISQNEQIPQPADPTKDGYTFDGWYREVGCTNAWVFASDVVTEAVTLYAKWTENSVAPPAPPAPTNPADLLDLTINTGTGTAELTPAFHRDSTHYTLSLPCGDTIVTITPSAPDGGTVTVNGKPATEDVVARNVGANTVNILSTVGGNTQNYVVDVIRPFPSTVIVQYWDDILAIDQSGGHQFEGYKWTGGGKTITTEKPYLSLFREGLSTAVGATYNVEVTMEGGQTIEVCGGKQVEAMVVITTLTAYPNPVHSIVTVSNPDYAGIRVIELFDINGQLVGQYPSTLTSHIDVSALPSGIYVLRAGRQTQKIIIE